MRKSLTVGFLAFACALPAVTGCTPTADMVSAPVERSGGTSLTLKDEAPNSIVRGCGANREEYKVLDDGAAVQFDAPYLEVYLLTCVIKRIGLSEVTLATSKPGDRMEADGYALTIVKSGGSQIAILEKD